MDKPSYTVAELEEMLRAAEDAEAETAGDGTGEDESLIEELRRRNSAQRYELSRLNQKLNYIWHGERLAELKNLRSSYFDRNTAHWRNYERSYTEALAGLAAILASVDNSERFSDALKDRLADFVQAAQDTKRNLDDTLSGLQRWQELSQCAT